MRRAEAHGRRGRARRHGAPILLIAGCVYLVMSAHGDAAPPDIVTTGTPLAYTENGVATAVDGALTITDVDGDDTVDSATVTISANYQSGADVLSFTNQLGVSGSWNSSTTTEHHETPPTTVAEKDDGGKGGRSGVGLYIAVLVGIAGAIAAGVVLMQRRIGS